MNVFYEGDSAFLDALKYAVLAKELFLYDFGHIIGLCGHPFCLEQMRAVKDRPTRPFSGWGPLKPAFTGWGEKYPHLITRLVMKDVFVGTAFCRFRVRGIMRLFGSFWGMPKGICHNGMVQIWDSGKSNQTQRAILSGLSSSGRYKHLLVTSANPKGVPALYDNLEAISWAEKVRVKYAFLRHPEEKLTPHLSQQIVELTPEGVVIRRHGNRDISPQIFAYHVHVREELE